ncbi:UDP-3-O-acyl-N-acetylglucosamine deacetylase [Glaesserella parasuis]|uniref:UDP-3-O-acyl-N-acetylglucosamine deacetylase n=1 Tax=Glaesserella parasuis ZJ0906 TaxID=1322346 RepID=A0A806J9Y7_GLAPU|nr:UDP-3-O-acyl-N-acetylglucosamine deacetylase [Glaesserella parasuis]AGO16466.1 UDP-3-O-[3-hydroxymyristoyl] N-acetylglucosamine deacetylase [Glaesserella parasuis ZJ0906]ATW45791.1 UDP-3-O-[3-hydroxymyristoyl] N-acetylglucosamine deacetylase [Glaesserella parasuis str. Nagasaki]EQA04073.1 UDP-3-O-[3-hydroxymyristoyl] N-acetylglucosamine deacetylase [Glaesserella parasuis str. Nagasaki]EYE71677.1 UDP-3-O-[3-hydroxymyristoyl] N-acetylglucosamine deacetylase [Glaesserella parasuis str. Nagasaki
MIKQRTLKQAAKVTGIGLHSGKKVTLTLRPAPANTGIIYARTDLKPVVYFPASAESIRDTQLCTCMINDEGVRISTVEHLNAAMSALGLDNLIVEVDAAEIPIMDGSSSPFIYLLLDAGIEEQDVPKKFIRIKESVRVEEGDKWAEFKPYSHGLKLDFTIDFTHPMITKEVRNYKMEFSAQHFIQQLSRARTFTFMKDVEYLQSIGLALGGSLDNAIVLDEYRILNEEGLRFKDELVRHKMLDAVGDLFMCGYNILGDFKAYKSGHSLNNKLLRAVLANENAWEFVTFDDKAEVPQGYQVTEQVFI